MRQVGLLILVASVGLGCGKNYSLVGEWTGETEVMGNPGNFRAQFRADGTFQMTSDMQFFTGRLVAVDTGTWKLVGDKLDITMTDTDWQFSGLSADRLRHRRASFESRKAQMIKEVNDEPPATVIWKGSNAVVIKAKDFDYELERVK